MADAAKEKAKVDTLTADLPVSTAVGPTPHLCVEVEGVLVTALVDSGSQSTIISRPLLHQISKKLQSQGKPLPGLLLPTVRLYGKDGRSKNQPLNITDEVVLKVAADGKTTSVPMFVQPDSEQPCLLGMNVIPTLGIKILRSNGKSLMEQPVDPRNTLTVFVSLVQVETIPGRKARFLDVCASTTLGTGDELLFQPDNSAQAQLDLSSADYLFTMKENELIRLRMEMLVDQKVIHFHKQVYFPSPIED